MAPLDGSNAPLKHESDPTMTIEQVETTTMPDGCVHVERMKNDDDESSTASIAMFDQDDFQEETWGSVVSPTSIAAVMAGVGLLTVLNPLVFVSLAATFVGGIHVVTHARELMLEEYEIWKNGEAASGQKDHVASTGDNGEEQSRLPIQEEPRSSAVMDDSIEAPTMVPTTNTTTTITPNATFETMKSSDDEETLHSNEVAQHFPPLDNIIISDQKFQGLNALEFFNVFLADDAPFSFREFQTKRGDFDIKYGSWTPATTEDAPLFSKKTQHLQRTLSFKTPTRNYFGPPHATCIKRQEIFMNKRVLVMESKVVLQGVPFCDRFSVQERWILKSPRSQEEKVATLHVYSQVLFTQPCPFEQQIHSKSRSTLSDVIHSWCTMAQQALSLTIRKKLEREQRALSHVNSECSIEVAHSHSSGKFIVVGEDENVPPMEIVATCSSPPRKNQPLQNLKRSVLLRMSKKMNQA